MIYLGSNPVGIAQMVGIPDGYEDLVRDVELLKSRKQEVIQHKTANEWLNDVSYRPALGEIVIYDKDTTHDYARIKIGDGSSLVSALPFIDAGSVNGEIVTPAIEQYDTFNNFPAVGNDSTLYYDKQQSELYCWVNSSGYVKISSAGSEYQSLQIKTVDTWDAGKMTNLTAQDQTLYVENGTVPTLTTQDQTVLTLKL